MVGQVRIYSVMRRTPREPRSVNGVNPMFYAPNVRRAAFVQAPRPDDAALQRFLLAAAAQAPVQQGLHVQDSEQATTLQLDVPGLAREHITIRLEDQQVFVDSVDGAPRQLKRAWKLPHEIDGAASNAKLENGVLSLVLAKRVPVPTAVTLAID